MPDKSTGWQRAKSGVQAAIVTGQVIVRAAGPLAPPPTPPDTERTLAPTASQTTQSPVSPGPTLADLTKQAADHQRMREQQGRRRAAELGYQLRSPEQREERSRGERQHERGR